MYKRYKPDYCCCTGTVHCRYCVRAGKPAHLTVDQNYDTVLISDKDKKRAGMNEHLETLLKNPGFHVDSLSYSSNILGTHVDFDIKAILIPGYKEPINELENMNNKLVTQDNFINAVKVGGNYIIGSIDNVGCVSFAQNPAYHASASSARAECKRLAKLTPGKLYIFVKLDGGEMVPANAISI